MKKYMIVDSEGRVHNFRTDEQFQVWFWQIKKPTVYVKEIHSK